MKKMFLIFFLISFSAVFSQEIRTRFSLYAPGLADSSSVYIAGSLPQLGNWNPSRVKMDAFGNGVWQKDILVAQSILVEYKYTLGSWDREAATENGSPLANFSVTLTNSKTIIDTVRFWKKWRRKNHPWADHRHG